MVTMTATSRGPCPSLTRVGGTTATEVECGARVGERRLDARGNAGRVVAVPNKPATSDAEKGSVNGQSTKRISQQA